MIAFVFSCAFIFASAYAENGWADTLNDLRNSAARVTSVQGEFTQYRHMEILSKPLVSGGVIFFQTPDSLRWEYRYPIVSILLTHNGATKRFVQRDGKLVEDASASLPFMQMVVQQITEWMKGRFDENPAFAVISEPGRKIALVPKKQSLAALIQRIEIVLSKRLGIIKSVTISEGKDSFTRLEFHHVVLNQPIKESLFQQP